MGMGFLSVWSDFGAEPHCFLTSSLNYEVTIEVVRYEGQYFEI